MPECPVFRRGDFVTLSSPDGRTMDAMVVVASENGQSVAVMFDGMFASYVSFMPMLWNEERGEFQDLLAGAAIGVKPMADSAD